MIDRRSRRSAASRAARAAGAGQGLLEYGVFLLLVAIVVIVALSLTGKQMLSAFQNIVNILRGP